MRMSGEVSVSFWADGVGMIALPDLKELIDNAFDYQKVWTSVEKVIATFEQQANVDPNKAAMGGRVTAFDVRPLYVLDSRLKMAQDSPTSILLRAGARLRQLEDVLDSVAKQREDRKSVV